MKLKPRLLDLCCNAGGASYGYWMAGFEVFGIDIDHQPHFPFKFWQRDLLKMNGGWIKRNFDAVVASPPCQAYTSLNALHGANYNPIDILKETRELVRETGLPYIIENVPGAPLINPIQICGSGLRMRIRRHRLFESNIALVGVECNHDWQLKNPIYEIWISKKRSNHGQIIRMSGVMPVHGTKQTKNGNELLHASMAMGISWMTKNELNQAIPPAYTMHLGFQLKKGIE